MRIAGIVCILGLLGAGTAAASAGAAGARPAAPAASAFEAGRARPNADRAKHAWLYVSGGNNVVDAYDLQAPSHPLVFSLSNDLDSPDGLMMDSHGRLYVSNLGNNTVAEFPFGETSPILTLSIGRPVSTAINQNDGDVYVATRGNPPSVAVFLPHDQTPSKLISSRLLQEPSQMVADAAGDIYIADNVSGVLLIPRAKYTVKSLGLKDLDGCTSGLALDETSNLLFVSDCTGGLQVYTIGSTYPTRSLSDNFPADYLALGTVQGNAELFAPDFSSDTVSAYYENQNSPFETIYTSAFPATGVVVKPENVP